MPSLFPPSLLLLTSPAPSTQPPPGVDSAAQAHLMPFHIAYDGPAPIDRYMVQNPDDVDDDDEDGKGEGSSSGVARSGALRSAFRGRALHSTRIQAPEGYELGLFALPGTAERRVLVEGPSNNSATSNTAARAQALDDEVAARNEADQRASKRARLEAKLDRASKKAAGQGRRAGFAKFSMDDSDDERGESDEGGGGGWSDDEGNARGNGWSDDEVSALPSGDALGSSSLQGTGVDVEEAEEPEDFRPLRKVRGLGSDLLVWGADGPVDLGDDGVVRCLREYVVLRELLAGRRREI